MTMKQWLIGGLTSAAILGQAEALTVYDPWNYAEALEQARTALKQLDELRSQLSEAQRLYDSFNSLRDLKDVGALLNNPEIRNVLPEDTVKLLSDGMYLYGDLKNEADAIHDKNRRWSPPAGSSPGNDFYADYLEKRGDRVAADAAIGNRIFETAAKRLDGLEELKTKLDGAHEAGEVMQIQARINLESAMTQNDLMRLQGLVMAQKAQADIEEQRAKEEERAMVDRMKQNIQSEIAREGRTPVNLSE